MSPTGTGTTSTPPSSPRWGHGGGLAAGVRSGRRQGVRVRLRTPICDLFDIDVPIVSAGMGGAAVPELAAAVSNAGGLGVLGAASCAPAELDEWITRTRRLTDRPFGVDTLLPASVPEN